MEVFQLLRLERLFCQMDHAAMGVTKRRLIRSALKMRMTKTLAREESDYPDPLCSQRIIKARRDHQEVRTHDALINAPDPVPVDENEDDEYDQEPEQEHVDLADYDIKQQVSVKVIPSNDAMKRVVRGEVLDDFEPVQQMSSSFVRRGKSVNFEPDRRMHEQHIEHVDSFLDDIKGHPKVFLARVNTRRRILALRAKQPIDVAAGEEGANALLSFVISLRVASLGARTEAEEGEPSSSSHRDQILSLLLYIGSLGTAIACGTAENPEVFEDSGDYPLLDRILGHRMLELAKGTKFSLDFQTLQESAQKKGKQPKGRHLVWVVLQKFRLEKDRGTSLTQHHLLSLTVSGSDAKGLDEFRQKFNYILEALEVDERPTDVGIRSLMYEQLKNHPKMWLYQKMCEVIEISQLDENTMAIDKEKKQKEARANAEAETPASPAPPKGAAVAIGSLPTSSAQTLSLSDCDASNAPVSKVDDGMCALGREASAAPARRGNPTKRANLKGRCKSTAFRDARTFIPRGVSFTRFFTAMMAATSCFSPLSNPPACAGLLGDLVPKTSDMEYLIDSGAGRNLISKSSLPEEAQGLFETAPEKLKFSTGAPVAHFGDGDELEECVAPEKIPEDEPLDEEDASNVACLRHFGGTRAHGKALCQVTSDCAPELTDAVKELGWLPSPGIPNDAFHNAKLERAIRSIKEGTRSVHLRAGFPHALWPRSVEFFCTAKAFTTEAPVHPNETEESEAFKKGKTCYAVANKGDAFEGLKVPLGALVYYKPAKHKDLPPFDPRTLPGIFCGWRIDHGFRFRGIHLVLDYESLRTNQKGCGRPIQVHEKELVVPDSFVFPLYEANALKLTSLSPEPSLPKIEPGESLPFEKGAPDPEVRKRRTYVTLERAIRFGKTMGCRGCDRIAEGVKHSDACHDRFAKLLEDERKAKLLEEERKAKEKRDEKPPAAEGDASEKPQAPVPIKISMIIGLSINKKGRGKEYTFGAQEAIDKEASGLLSNDTWSYDEVVSREELMRSKTPLNIGDDIRDENNNLAVLQELKVNPSGLTGINFNLAYGLLLSLYVDDILLSGPAKNHARFWDLLQKHLEIEEPSPVDRVLGRKHLLSHDADSTTLQHDMSDFCQNCCELYEQLSGRKLKAAATPFDSNIPVSDFEEKGLLAEAASKILMKILWCARLARPDLMKPISDLTRKVTCWSLADDKKLYKLMCYLHSTPKLSLTCKIADSMDDLRLGLYTDADHSSEIEHAKSTSGSLLVLEGPNSWWPLSWASKKQTATSRSTTEAEIISLASGLFGEAMPMQELAELVFKREVDLYCYQDNSAVIQIVQSGYSAKLRHVSKTHRINLSSLYEVFEDPHTNLGYIATDKQCADIFTKALPPVKFPAALQLLKMQRL
ncbi:unnamed protein product [Symbiodinium sp. CCMP2592]|nr:unnamed protein product [Symbiodinium sp. CCMP2592]